MERSHREQPRALVVGDHVQLAVGHQHVEERVVGRVVVDGALQRGGNPQASLRGPQVVHLDRLDDVLPVHGDAPRPHPLIRLTMPIELTAAEVFPLGSLEPSFELGCILLILLYSNATFFVLRCRRSRENCWRGGTGLRLIRLVYRDHCPA